MVQFNFNAQEYEPNNGGFDAIPAGQYEAIITNTEMKANRKQNGHYLEIECEILNGDFKGRRLWDRLNLNNPSQEAVAIAQGRLSAICRAAEVMELSDTAQLHNKPLLIKVSKVKRNDNDEWTNDIKAWYAVSTKRAALQGVPASTPPWQTKTDDCPF